MQVQISLIIVAQGSSRSTRSSSSGRSGSRPGSLPGSVSRWPGSPSPASSSAARISGPGPIVIRGSLSISVFLFEISWDETFTLGTVAADAPPPPRPLLDVLAETLAAPGSLRAAADRRPRGRARPEAPRPRNGARPADRRTPGPAARRAARREDRPVARAAAGRSAGRPGHHPGNRRPGRLRPGSFLTLSDAEKVNRRPFEDLPAGRTLTPADPAVETFPQVVEDQEVRQIVIDTRTGRLPQVPGRLRVLDHLGAVVDAARAEPALSDLTPVLSAQREQWAGARRPDDVRQRHRRAPGRAGERIPRGGGRRPRRPVRLAGVV